MSAAAFNKAVEIVKNLPKDGPTQTSNDEKLQVCLNVSSTLYADQAFTALCDMSSNSTSLSIAQ